MRSWTRPTVEQVQYAVEKIRSHPVHWQSFFRNLENPLWAKPLLDVGAFDNLFAVCDGDQGYLEVDIWWPEGLYLVRVAAENPEVVLAIARRMSECSSNNTAATSIVVRAVAKLNVCEIKSVFKLLVDWAVQVRHMPRMGICLISIVLALLGGGCSERAKQLARVVWPLGRSLRVTTKQTSESDARYVDGYPEAKDLMRESEFQQCIRTYSASMIEADPCATLDIFREMLIECVKLERSTLVTTGPIDGSFIWRPAIEEHEQNSSFDWRNAIVDVARNAAISCYKSRGGSSSALEEVTAILQQFSSPIFLRIAIYMCSNFVPQFIDSSSLFTTVMSCKTISSAHVHHELYWLVQKVMPVLDNSRREQLLEGWCKAFMKDSAKPIGWTNVEDAELLRWFSSLVKHLPVAAQERIEELNSRGVQVPTPPDFGVYVISGWIRRTAPFDEDQLDRMTTQELINVLSKWKPTGDMFADTPIKLAEVLANVVEQRFLELLPQLSEFIALDATYLTGVVQGIEGYTKSHELADEQWMIVLEFVQEVCSTVSSRNTEIDVEIYHHPVAVQHCTAALLMVALKRRSLSKPLLLEIWKVINLLLNCAFVDNQVREVSDVYWLSVNSALGMSLHCAINYLLAAKRLTEIGNEDRQEARQMITGPLQVLGKQLCRVDGGEIMARAVCGGRLAELYCLDEKWVSDNRNTIFARGDDSDCLWLAAWSAFVRYNHPHKVFVRLLIAEYAHALTLYIGQPSNLCCAEWWSKYIHHLCVLQVRGSLGEQSGGAELWDKFISVIDKASLKATIRCIGTMLSNQSPTDAELPLFEAGMERAKVAWTRILTLLKSGEDGDPRRKGAAAFGWWAPIEQLDPDWFMENATQAVEVAGEIDNLWTVFAWIAQSDRFDGKLLFQLVSAIGEAHAIYDLSTADVSNIIKVFKRIGTGLDDSHQMALKKSVESFAPLDEKAFTGLFCELFG